MVGRLLHRVVCLSLAMLLIANGPANVYAHALVPGCGCPASAASAAAQDSEGIPPACPSCCHAHEEEGEVVTEAPAGCRPAPNAVDPAGQVEADCPCCPHCPTCPNGCFVCGVCKPSSLHPTTAITVDLRCVGRSLADLCPNVPAPPLNELLQVPRA